MHSVVIDIDNNDPEPSRKSEVLFVMLGFFLKWNCLILCDIYPLRIFKILKIGDSYKTCYKKSVVCEVPHSLIILDK